MKKNHTDNVQIFRNELLHFSTGQGVETSVPTAKIADYLYQECTSGYAWKMSNAPCKEEQKLSIQVFARYIKLSYGKALFIRMKC